MACISLRPYYPRSVGTVRLSVIGIAVECGIALVPQQQLPLAFNHRRAAEQAISSPRTRSLLTVT